MWYGWVPVQTNCHRGIDQHPAEEFFKYILDVASDRKKTKNEINGYREIAIFKNGVTL